MKNIKGYLILIVVFTVSSMMRAQSPANLTVSPDGSVAAGAVCPETRDSAAYASLAAASACAQAGDTLSVAPGTYYENLVIDKSLTIQGAGASATVIDGGTAGRVFAVSNDVTLTLTDLTITGGAFDNGAGVYTYAGHIVIERSVISGNQATSAGGGLYVHSGSAIVRDSTLATNSILAYSNDDALADAFGAGAYVYSGTLTLDNTIISGNTATAQTCGTTPAHARGGGLYTYTGQIVMRGGLLSGNVVHAESCSPAITTLEEGIGLYTEAGTASFEMVARDDDIVRATSSVVMVDGEPFAPAPIVTEAAVIVAEPTEALVIAAVTPVPTFLPTIAPSLPEPAAIPADPTIVTASETALVSAPAEEGDALIAVRWMDQIMAAVQAEKFSPPMASRVYACAGVTLYEALVSGLVGYRSLSGQIHGLVVLPQPEPGLVYDYPLVANAAMAALTQGLFADASEPTQQAFAGLRQSIELERGETVPMNVFARSIELGQQIGSAMLEWAHSDNYAVIHDMAYTLPVDQPQFWSPLEGQKALEPYWGMLRPSVLPLISICDVEPSIPFSSEVGSPFYEQENEVYSAGVNLTDEQRQIALFWADGSSETATPPGHWISIVGQVVRQQGLSLSEAARAYALTSVAMGDAFIATWAMKYRLQIVRPITYINRYIDPNWTPLLKTPPFPDYPSGHSVSSGAAAAVLTGLLGEIAFTDATHEPRQLSARSFDSFEQAAQEAALSRLYGGIHYREAIENGLQQGQCIGEIVLSSLVTIP